MRFHGEGMYQWDTWYFATDDEVHAFYLQQLRPNSDRTQWDADSIGHAVSRNLVDWEELPPVVPPAEPGSEGDLVNWTGSTVEMDGTYYLFYTIRSSSSDAREQTIGLATSPDLYSWTKHPANPVLTPDPRWYNTVDAPGPAGVVDCRDLMVVKHPSRPGWFGVFATRINTQEPAEGAVFAGAYSEDLVHWEQTPPVLRSAENKWTIVEMPDLFEFEGRWYLTWLEDNNYGNREVLGDYHLSSGTLYAVSDVVEGPYVAPDGNVILASMGFNGISCRTVVFRGVTYVLYTSCERENENELKPTFGVLSLPKEVRVVDGRLRAVFAPLVLEELGAGLIIDPEALPALETAHTTHETRVDWTPLDGGRRAAVRTAWARETYAPVATDFYAEMSVTLEEGVAAGTVVRQDGTKGGVALLDVEKQRVMFCTIGRFQVVDMRELELVHGRTYRLAVVGNGEFIEVYVDDVLTLQFVWYGPRHGRLGMLVDRGTATFGPMTATALATRQGATA